MSDIIKKPYEISLWDDILVFDVFAMSKVSFTGETSYEPNKFYYLDNKSQQFILDESKEAVPKREYFIVSEKLDTFEGKLEDKQYETYVKIFQYYKERKLCIIGSDTMTSPSRAIQSKLVSSTNGSNTLTFSMYYKYYDEEEDEIVVNPYNKLLTNERKIKLRYGPPVDSDIPDSEAPDTKWYDFVIKDVQENSENNTFTYTCKDLYINELSKSGFSIQLDAELENNTGTVTELAEKILEGSDWSVSEVNDNLRQYKEEPLYEITLGRDIEAVDIVNQTSITIPAKDENGNDNKIYVFYSIISEQNPQLQLLYPKDGIFKTDDDRLIDKDKHPNYLISNVIYDEYKNGTWPNFVKAQSNNNQSTDTTATKDQIALASFTNEYRGNKLVRQQKIVYDAKIDKYVREYQDTSKNRYGVYTESEYISPAVVQNLITNPSEFENGDGWKSCRFNWIENENNVENKDINIVLYANGQEISLGTNDSINSTDSGAVKSTDNTEIENVNFKSYIQYIPPLGDSYLKNTGIKDNLSSINSFSNGDEYIVRLYLNYSKKINALVLIPISEIFIGNWEKVVEKDKDGNIIGTKINIDRYFKSQEINRGFFEQVLQSYEKFDENQVYYIYESESKEYIQCKGLTEFDKQKTYYKYITNGFEIKLKYIYEQPISYSELIKKYNLGLYIKFDDKLSKCNIEKCLLFPYAEDADGKMCIPGEDIKSVVKTKYFCYKKDDSYSSIDNVKYVYTGYDGGYVTRESDSKLGGLGLTPVYQDDYSKIRSITATESNRFNLLQDLCEIFECWISFDIEHNMKTGEIKYEDISDYKRQKKSVTFHEYIGVPNYAGFKYGINLKSIQRTLNSDAIISKLIVKDNANEFANNGFCSIARADENYCGENFILNFDYYIQQGMLDWDIINNDLYISENGYIGLYKKLNQYNKERENYIEEKANLTTDIAKYKSNLTTYEVGYNSIVEELENKKIEFKKLTGREYSSIKFMSKNFDDLVAAVSDTEMQQWLEQEEVIKILTSILVLTQKEEVYLKNKGIAQDVLDSAETLRDSIDDQVEQIVKLKENILSKFYTKYSRFLQEGSWINEDYIDDNLYYLDAESTLNSSAKPKVTYNINVLELSQLEGYENYNFKLGDRTYIEDTEFFGWVYKNGVRTPYHEEIVVTEITIELDSPESNTIKVQNFKTQFDDLFQRMAATTQSVEYHTGEYSKITGVVTPQGTIDTSVLQNSFLNNSFILSNSQDQSVVWDSSGITTTSLSKPNQIVRIVSGGIFISNDGGASYNTGITGSGINANYLTSGQINTSKINIMSGSFPTFRWDSTGLNAYSYDWNNQTKQPQNFNYANFVRFDQYGIYGIKGIDDQKENFIPSEKDEDGLLGEDKIWSKANFALTWKGFMLKTNNGSVKITSENDIQVFGGDKERIKIGRFDKEITDAEGNVTVTKEAVYGIRIKNAKGAPVMETDSDGELWLKNRLRVGTNDTSTVGIGYLNDIRENTIFHEVIHAGDEVQNQTPFIVYEDGHVVANYIEAKGGKIGNMEIQTIEDRGYKVVITSNVGNSMKEGTTVILTATLYKDTTPIDNSKVKYYWYDSEGNIINEDITSNQLQIDRINFTNGFVQYKCKVELKEETNG